MLDTSALVPVRKGISGSRIAGVAGLSPWLSPHDVWLEIFGLGGEKETTDDLLRGAHLDEGLARWYAEKTGQHVSHVGRNQKTLVHPEYPLVRAKPDAQVHETPTSKAIKPFEGKSPGKWTIHDWGEPGTDQIPEHYIPQGTWEAAVMGAKETDFGALIDGGLPIYTLPYNHRLFEALLHIAEKFWRDHIETRIPPPPDASEGARRVLGKLYPHATHDVIEATEEQIELFRDYEAAKALIKEGELRKKKLDAQIMALIGDHEGLASPIATAYWRERTGKLSWKKLAEYLMQGYEEDKKAELLQNYTGNSYRHFQIYPKKRSKK